jgi:hypothetical protein
MIKTRCAELYEESGRFVPFFIHEFIPYSFIHALPIFELYEFSNFSVALIP